MAAPCPTSASSPPRTSRPTPARTPGPVMARLEAGGTRAPTGEITVHFAAGSQATPLYDRTSLRAGTHFAGPAIITQLDATTLVPPGWDVEVHPSACLLLRRA